MIGSFSRFVLKTAIHNNKYFHIKNFQVKTHYLIKNLNSQKTFQENFKFFISNLIKNKYLKYFSISCLKLLDIISFSFITTILRLIKYLLKATPVNFTYTTTYKCNYN